LVTASRGRFKRQESWRLKRVKENWRRPRGVTSRMRKEKNGWPALVKAGHGSDGLKRGRHPRGLVERLVQNESDLEGLNPKLHIVRLSGRLGERRRLVLVERVRSLNVHIANPGRQEARPVSEEAPVSGGTSVAESTEAASTGASEAEPVGSDSLVEAEESETSAGAHGEEAEG
jgi:large subunit ribosomal protein L32e